MMEYLGLAAVGYLLGSVPFGLIAGRLLGGVDVREHGSGSTGMTNVLRTVGLRAAFPVLLLDMSKSVLAIALARVLSGSPGVEATAGLAALVGHNWPLYVGFRGGKGTAPGWGGLLFLSPMSGLVGGAVGVAAIAIWRYVSLGSLLGAVTGSVLLIVLSLSGLAPLEYVWYGIIGAPLVVAKHRENISRLIRGEERRLGRRAAGATPQQNIGRRRGLRWPRSA